MLREAVRESQWMQPTADPVALFFVSGSGESTEAGTRGQGVRAFIDDRQRCAACLPGEPRVRPKRPGPRDSAPFDLFMDRMESERSETGGGASREPRPIATCGTESTGVASGCYVPVGMGRGRNKRYRAVEPDLRPAFAVLGRPSLLGHQTPGLPWVGGRLPGSSGDSPSSPLNAIGARSSRSCSLRAAYPLLVPLLRGAL